MNYGTAKIAITALIVATVLFLVLAAIYDFKIKKGDERTDRNGKTDDYWKNHPTCFTCRNLQHEVIDDFPVCNYPYCGEILKPYTICCDEYTPNRRPEK